MRGNVMRQKWTKHVIATACFVLVIWFGLWALEHDQQDVLTWYVLFTGFSVAAFITHWWPEPKN
jgi:hypothetical protein